MIKVSTLRNIITLLAALFLWYAELTHPFTLIKAN